MSNRQSSELGITDSLLIEDSWDRLHEQLSKKVNAELSNSLNIKILEAGCGRRWLLNLPDVKYRLVGLDRDEYALQARLKINKDLDETIVGDLETINLLEQQFGMIYCSYVLEHIENAEELLSRMLTWLRPGGLIVLKIPVRESVFGFITRMTPFWFHILYHKYILRVPGAGTIGHSPYPTFYDPIVSLNGLLRFAFDNGLSILFASGTNFRVSSNNLVQGASGVICKTLAILSLGKLRDDLSGLAIVLKKTS